MPITLRAEKCRMDSFSRAGQLVLIQRRAASPSWRTTRPPQTGHSAGMRNGRGLAAFSTTRTTLGITSPLRSISTVSPISTPSRPISSSLCSVARETVTPPTGTALKCATGVSVPVRPTWTSMLSTTVCSAGNLKAIAQRGALAVHPSSRCWLTESTLATIPSVS